MLVLVHTPYYQETDEYLWQLERAMPAHDFVRLEELNSEELQVRPGSNDLRCKL